MSGERGQATVELAALAAVFAVAAVCLHALLVLWAAQGRAQGIADQAAVLVAEGRPIPAALRRGAHIRRSGHVLMVRLPVSLAGGMGRTDAVARAELP
ncbi:MAG TPA: hypothetical protein VGI72_12880 [Gaiellales bacterium]